jgi:hypothetical protein
MKMKRRQDKKTTSILVLLALAIFVMIFPLGPVGALAQSDRDGDGFFDTVEESGFNLPSGLWLADTHATYLEKCMPGVLRNQCVDPDSKDLFVIIERLSPSNIPVPPYDNNFNLDPLGFIYPGLGVTTHELRSDNPNPSQSIEDYVAVKVVEDSDPDGDLMGLATFGTPYPFSVATVWPVRIKNWIDARCNQACFTDKTGNTTCYTPDQAGTFQCINKTTGTTVDMKQTQPNLDKLNNEFIQNIINHEVSHMIHLAFGPDTFDHHYLTHGSLMEKFIDAKESKDKKTPPNISVILYVSTSYLRADRQSYELVKP